MCWFWVYLSAFSLNKSFWKSLRQLYIYSIVGQSCSQDHIAKHLLSLSLFWPGTPGNARKLSENQGLRSTPTCQVSKAIYTLEYKIKHYIFHNISYFVEKQTILFYHSGSGNQTLSSSPTDSIEFWFFLSMCVNMWRKKAFNHFLTQKHPHIGL